MTHESRVKDDERDQDRSPGRHSKETEAGANGDELGDESEEVAYAEIDHGKPAPEGAEALEDQLGVSAMRGGAEAHGHFLNDDRHAEREGDERDEESYAKLGARSRVGEHARAVVFSQHDQDTGADQQPQQARSGGKTTLGTGRRNSDAIVGTVNVFVSNDYGFVCVLGENGLHR